MKISRGCGWILLVLAGLLVLSTPATSQTDSGAQATFYRDMAAQDRAHAADARQRAKQWEDMAAKASSRAAAAAGSLKESWERIAKDDTTSAKELYDEAEMWEQKARQLDAQAEQAEEKATAANQPPPAPSVPATAVKEDEIKELLGEWVDEARGTTVAIEVGAGSNQSLILKGKHGDWKGTYTRANGSQSARVVFTPQTQLEGNG